jgi:hypothetical protein
MSWPSISTRPASGVSKPANTRNSVVLPQPEPPSRGQLAALDLEIDAVDRGHRAEALGQSFDPDDRFTHQRPVLIVVHNLVRSRTCSAVPALMV